MSRSEKQIAHVKSLGKHNRKYPKSYDTSSRLYRIWRAMYFRCYQKSHAAYSRYGGRGIGICDEWRNDYLTFMGWALATGYEEHLEIERKDNDLGYYPDNCKWVTRKQQTLNRRSSLAPVSAFGEQKSLSEWRDDPRCVVSYKRLWLRLIHGWPAEIAIQTPAQSKGSKLIGFVSGGRRPKGSKIAGVWRGPS